MHFLTLLILCSNPVMAKVAAVLSSTNLIDPVLIQADRTFRATILYITSFVIEATFLQWKGNLETFIMSYFLN